LQLCKLIAEGLSVPKESAAKWTEFGVYSVAEFFS
jgi:hypothetical protein